MITPLLLKGAVLSEIWGGTSLKEYIATEEETISSVYLLKADGKNCSTVKSGEQNGLSLPYALEVLGKGALGKRLADFKKFPFSVTLIDSAERTPLYVSTADRLWYVLDAQRDAELMLGLKKRLTGAEFEKYLAKGELSVMFNLIKVKKGQALFIPAGTPFAAGAGVTLAQVAAVGESYCISDYGRVYEDGHRIPLQTKKAFEALNFKALPTPQDDTVLYPFGTVKTLAAADGFIGELLELDGNAGLYDKNSISALLVTDGKAVISYPSGNLSLKKGDCALLPADLRIILSGRAQIINVHL